MTERSHYRVIEIKSWSYVEGPDGTLDGPWRYRWEAQELADKLNSRNVTTETSP